MNFWSNFMIHEERTTLSGNLPKTVFDGVPNTEKNETGTYKDYWILSDDERSKGFVRPVRTAYVHNTCGSVTTMNIKIAETYARDNKFYGSTFCCSCMDHFPVEQFLWDKTNEVVGS